MKVLFYDYLLCYEQNIKKLKSNKEDNTLISKFNDLIVEFNIKLIGRTIDQISNTKESENIIYMTRSKSIPLDFLRHLRNCLAHVNIEKNGDNYILKDFKNKSVKTMSGIVNKDFLINLIKSIKNEN